MFSASPISGRRNFDVKATPKGVKMKSKTKMRLAAGLSAGAMMLSLTGPAFAAPSQANFGNLIAALNNVNVEINNLEALNNLTIQDVRVVNVEDVLNGNNVNALNNNDVDVAVLQDFLNNSLNNNNVEILNDALNNNNVLITDVVAIDVLSGGDIVVFAR